jgi:peptidoglycan/LPS O-acetylase OafA/YrhL
MILIRIFFGNEEIARLYLDLPPYHNWFQSPIALTPFYALILLVLELTEDNNSFGNIMGSTFFYTVGEISYSAYLVHMGILEIYIIRSKIKGFDGTCACSFVIFIISTIFFHIFEKNGVMIGNKLIRIIKDFRIRKYRKEFQELQESDHSKVVG